MLSKRMAGWKWYDTLFVIAGFLLVFTLVTAAIHGFAPTSGASQAISKAGHQIAGGLMWIAQAFILAANWCASW